MAQATFVSGSPVMADYTPSGADVAAGEVKVVGALPCIAHRKISDGSLGALAVGSGIYKVTAGGAISAGAACYWDDTNNKVVASGVSGAKHFGFAAPGNAATKDGDVIEVIHAPDGSALA